jgi:hypothetical protein
LGIGSGESRSHSTGSNDWKYAGITVLRDALECL